ncbi:MAG: multidrug effflux MFS transporter [Francisellaceae bacterium]
MPQTTSSHPRVITIIILFLICVMVATTDLYIPSLPAISASLGSSTGRVQLMVTFYLCGYAISPLVYGPLSDAYGRRGILLLGLSIAIAGSVLCVFSTKIGGLLLGRLIQGLGMGAGSAMMRAIFRDAFSGKALATAGSRMGMVSSISLGLAPAFGGLIQQYGFWRLNFILILIAMILLFIVIFRYLPETHVSRNKQVLHPLSWFRHYFELLRSPHFVLPTLLSGLAFSGLIVYITTAPFLMQNVLKLTSGEFGLLAFLIALAQFSGFHLNSRMLKRFSIDQTLFSGIAVMFIAGAVLVGLSLFDVINTISIIAMVMLYVIGTGFIFAGSYAKTFTPFGHIIGFAAAAYGMLQTMVGGVTSLVLSILPSFSQLVIGSALSLLAVLAFVVLFLMNKWP